MMAHRTRRRERDVRARAGPTTKAGTSIFLLVMGEGCASIVAIGFVVGTTKKLAFCGLARGISP